MAGMALTIDSSDILTRRYITLGSTGVVYCDSPVSGSGRSFLFSQIECILFSSDGVLSFQVGDEIFKIQTKAGDANHRNVIETFVNAVNATATV
jgi:hypothetical protein